MQLWLPQLNLIELSLVLTWKWFSTPPPTHYTISQLLLIIFWPNFRNSFLGILFNRSQSDICQGNNYPDKIRSNSINIKIYFNFWTQKSLGSIFFLTPKFLTQDILDQHFFTSQNFFENKFFLSLFFGETFFLTPKVLTISYGPKFLWIQS